MNTPRALKIVQAELRRNGLPAIEEGEALHVGSIVSVVQVRGTLETGESFDARITDHRFRIYLEDRDDDADLFGPIVCDCDHGRAS